jgi:hypothetical protein
MWAFLASAAEGSRRAETLEGAVDFAELIVIGRYVGLERGAVYGSDATAVALIKVDSVAKGNPILGDDGLLRVEFVLVVGGGAYPEKEYADLERSVPTEPALLFLFTWKRYLEMIGGGFPAFEARDDLHMAYKTIGGDGAIRVVEGRMAPSSFAEGGWPIDLRAVELTTVLARIRAANQ